MAYYQFNLPNPGIGIFAGGGLNYHIILEVSGSGNLSNINVDTNNSLGYSAEAGVIFGILATGFYYKIMDLQVSDTGSKLNGNSIGFSLGLTWPAEPEKTKE